MDTDPHFSISELSNCPVVHKKQSLLPPVTEKENVILEGEKAGLLKTKSDWLSWGDSVVLNHPVKTSILPSGHRLGAEVSIPSPSSCPL
jgi:hypothetical protein